MLQNMAAESAQPVVGMNDICAAVFFDVLQNTSSELRDNVEHVVFWHVHCTGSDVHNLVIWLNNNLARGISALSSRVGGAIDTGMRQSGNKFTHIHIHSTTVADTWLSQWRGVKRENGNTEHAQCNLSRGVWIPLVGGIALGGGLRVLATDKRPIHRHQTEFLFWR